MHTITKINNDFRRRSRKVLLLVDNAAGHNIKKETKTKLTNVLSNLEGEKRRFKRINSKNIYKIGYIELKNLNNPDI